MTEIISVLFPVYSRPDKLAIDCLVTFDTIGQHPYTATATDSERHGAALWEALQAGTYGVIGNYVAPPSPPPPPEPTKAELQAQLDAISAQLELLA